MYPPSMMLSFSIRKYESSGDLAGEVAAVVCAEGVTVLSVAGPSIRSRSRR